MNRIKLATSDIFTKNGQKVKIIIKGIDLSTRFDENPIMLYNHNSDKVLGKWTAINVDETSISAIPDFDDDVLSVDVSKKYNKGTLKFASAGLDITDAYIEDDVLVIAESVMIESSIAGIPANTKAKKMDFSKDSIMLFSNGEAIDTSEYTNKLINMSKTNEPKVDNLEEVIEEVKVEGKTESKEEVKATKEDKKEEKEEIKEEVKTVSELDTLKLSLENKETELNTLIEDNKATKLELGLEIKSLTEKLELSAESLKASENRVNEKDKTIGELKASIDTLNSEKMETILDAAVESGKITKEAKADFLELSFEKAKSILKNIIPNEVSLSDTIKMSKTSKGDNKDYDWYLNNAPQELREMAHKNPALYAKLEQDSIR